jgi:hypothetical protein
MKASLAAKRAAIMATSYSYVDAEDGDWVTVSPLAPTNLVMGVADTKEEAVQIFKDLLDDYMDDLATGRPIYDNRKAGRPAKNKLSFRVDIDPVTKERFAALAKKLGISQGEAVDLVFQVFEKQGQLVNQP